MRSIGIDEHDDVARGFVERKADRVAFPLAAIEYDPRALRRGDLPGPVARVPVDDENLVGKRTDLVDDLADQAFFVPGRNDNGNLWCGHRR